MAVNNRNTSIVESEQAEGNQAAGEPLKVCRRCKEEKPLSEYYKDKLHKDGYFLRCKSCIKFIQKSYKVSSREKIRRARRLVSQKKENLRYRKIQIAKKSEIIKRRVRQVSEVKKEAKKQIEWLETAIAHIIKDDSWNKSTSKQVHLEIIVRAIMSYHKLQQEGIVAFSEFAFLITGSQFEYFSRHDVELRTGRMKYFKRDLLACISAGLIMKIEKKQLYYLTLAGKERFDAILGHIYREKGLGTKVYRNTRKQ